MSTPYSTDPALYIYTSLTASSSHIVTATSRLETILRANRVPFKAVDLATDDKARILWGRRAGKDPDGRVRKLPGLVQEGLVLGDIVEIEDWNEYGELKQHVKLYYDEFTQPPISQKPPEPPVKRSAVNKPAVAAAAAAAATKAGSAAAAPAPAPAPPAPPPPPSSAAASKAATAKSAGTSTGPAGAAATTTSTTLPIRSIAEEAAAKANEVRLRSLRDKVNKSKAASAGEKTVESKGSAKDAVAEAKKVEDNKKKDESEEEDEDESEDESDEEEEKEEKEKDAKAAAKAETKEDDSEDDDDDDDEDDSDESDEEEEAEEDSKKTTAAAAQTSPPRKAAAAVPATPPTKPTGGKATTAPGLQSPTTGAWRGKSGNLAPAAAADDGESDSDEEDSDDNDDDGDGDGDQNNTGSKTTTRAAAQDLRRVLQSPTSTRWKPTDVEEPVTSLHGARVDSGLSATQIAAIEKEQAIKEEDDSDFDDEEGEEEEEEDDSDDDEEDESSEDEDEDAGKTKKETPAKAKAKAKPKDATT
ncbi:Thioredoxin-like fold protein [Niveomyces insectorum RCEF 264]|uniref:Thioredoxin-like fold protein n=1 Tax=Niveomyces insectorum RCEF 264 TaxID=1081102 RepID=A0A167TXH0_9HYPO|nr:Thioredoxin-like fold protein [Niveomyces insectorum RCEF 264]